MPTFVYEAIGPGGVLKKGELEARSQTAAGEHLSRQRLQPLWIKAKLGGASNTAQGQRVTSKPAEPVGDIRLSAKRVMQFTEELSDLLDAGLQLESALGIMENRKEESGLKKIAAYVRKEVRDGVAFSPALRKATPSFGELFCNLVSAGEQSGALPSILKRTLAYQKLVADLKAKVAGALVYPAFIAMAGVVLMVLFVSYLVPQLGVLLGTTGDKMPLATRALIAASEFVGAYWWLILVGLAGMIFLLRWAVSTRVGRVWWHENQLRLPLIGRILRARFYAQFAQTLATLTANGIVLSNALKLTNAATPNVYLRSHLEHVADHVGEGVALSRALDRTKAFPSIFIDMIVLGEQTGNMARALEKTGERYDKELNLAIGALTAMIQPAVIVFMAGVVGLVAYSMMGGIFQAVSGLRGS